MISLLDICPLRFLIRLYPSSIGAIWIGQKRLAIFLFPSTINLKVFKPVKINIATFFTGLTKYNCLPQK